MGHAECHHENGTRFQQLTSKNPPNFGEQLEKMWKHCDFKWDSLLFDNDKREGERNKKRVMEL